MTSPTRFLSPSPSPQSPSNSDVYMMGILASLLCALVCIAGLSILVRCAWVRRHVVVPRAFPSSTNKGVQKRVLNTLPKLSFNADEESRYDDCAICLTEFEDGEQIRVLPRCGHGFHVVCIDTWLKSHSSCPTCRQIVVSVSTCLKCGAVGDSRYLP